MKKSREKCNLNIGYLSFAQRSCSVSRSAASSYVPKALLIAVLFLATGTAHAAQPLWLPSAQYEKPTFDKEMLPKPPSHFPLLPPSIYDRPYVGRLTLEISADPNCLGNAIACSQGGQFSCQIKMMLDEVIISRGFDPLDVFRHEQGHCNGWMSDHRDSDPEW